MDVVRFINESLSCENIQRFLRGDANIIKYSEPGNLYDIDQLLTDDMDYCIILYSPI